MSRLLVLALAPIIGLFLCEQADARQESGRQPRQQQPAAQDAEALRLAADQGDAGAQFTLGVSYANGEGVPQDLVEALRWYRLSAEQGYGKAQCNLGRMMSVPGPGRSQNDVEAHMWFSLSDARLTGEDRSRCGSERLAVAARMTREQLVEAFRLVREWKPGAGGVSQDDVEAVRRYRLAADQGDASAQYNLGFMYATGQGVPQDGAEAVRWFRLAADQGFADAQANLGFMYATGQGVAQDDVEAHMWYILAAARSSGEVRDVSVKARNDVAERMTSEQIAEAQRLAREWKPRTER